jgi:hypothetical protein
MNRGGQREEEAIQVGMDEIKSFEKSQEINLKCSQDHF